MVFDVIPEPTGGSATIIIIGVIAAVIIIALAGYLIFRVLSNKKIDKANEPKDKSGDIKEETKEEEKKDTEEK